MNEGISKLIQYMWAFKELSPIFMVLMQVIDIIWREGGTGQERRERGEERQKKC